MRPIRNRVAKLFAIAAFVFVLLAAQSAPAQAWGSGGERAPSVLSVDDGGFVRP